MYDVPQPFGDIYPDRVALATGAKGLWYILSKGDGGVTPAEYMVSAGYGSPVAWAPGKGPAPGGRQPTAKQRSRVKPGMRGKGARDEGKMDQRIVGR